MKNPQFPQPSGKWVACFASWVAWFARPVGPSNHGATVVASLRSATHATRLGGARLMGETFMPFPAESIAEPGVSS